MKKLKKKDMGHIWSETCCEYCTICGERKYYWEQMPKKYQTCRGPKPKPKPEPTREDLIKTAVDKFLCWSLPVGVRSDECALIQGYPNRSGTNLLTADEAKQMFEHCLSELIIREGKTD